MKAQEERAIFNRQIDRGQIGEVRCWAGCCAKSSLGPGEVVQEGNRPPQTLVMGAQCVGARKVVRKKEGKSGEKEKKESAVLFEVWLLSVSIEWQCC